MSYGGTGTMLSYLETYITPRELLNNCFSYKIIMKKIKKHP